MLGIPDYQSSFETDMKKMIDICMSDCDKTRKGKTSSDQNGIGSGTTSEARFVFELEDSEKYKTHGQQAAIGTIKIMDWI